MERLSATDAVRRFSDVLDAVETKGETFMIVRRGRAVARLSPATGAAGSDVKALLRKAPHDPEWLDAVRGTRAMLESEDRPWHG